MVSKKEQAGHSHLVRELKRSMQALSDRLLGGLLLAVSTFVFSYYTLWALVTVSPQSTRLEKGAAHLILAIIFSSHCSHQIRQYRHSFRLEFGLFDYQLLF